MMEQTKIQLSVLEMDLLTNADWILTKNAVIEKVKCLFGRLQTTQQEILSAHSSWLPPEVLSVAPKISKGENYKGLPWLMLDQPRYFNKDHIFAIRSMCWWGNFFSSTLHLSGRYKKTFTKAIESSFDHLKEAGYYICIHEDEWQHSFEPENFMPVYQLTNHEFSQLINRKQFIKLSNKIALTQWKDAEQRLAAILSEYLLLLSGQLPRR